MSEYPSRSSHFAHRFCRLLAKAAVAQEIGPEACWLLTVIAHQEDAKRYAGPVSFWNEQLMPLCGFTSPGRLIRQRTRAVEAGWLHYEAGGKGKVGRYWVLVPDGVSTLADGSSDGSHEHELISKTEIEADELISKTEIEAGLRFQNGKGTVGQTEGKRSANGNHSTLTLFPYPTSCSQPSSTVDEPASGVGAFPVKRETPKDSIAIWILSQHHVDLWRDTYQCDVLPAIREARVWCISNAEKRKTPNGMVKFLSSWLSRGNNRGTLGRASHNGNEKPIGAPVGPWRKDSAT